MTDPIEPAEHTPHATMPHCPRCTATEKCVLNLNDLRFHCFNCGAEGTFGLTFSFAAAPDTHTQT